MDRADLELVTAIARTGSLSGAARELHIAQPPLSRRLQQLERTVGASLFLRGRHGATPTAVGRVVIDGATAALRALQHAERSAADAAAGRAGALRIGVTPTLGAVLLPAALAAFRASHPDVRFELASSGDSAWLRTQAAAGAFDVTLAALAGTAEPGTRVALRGEQRFVLIAPRELRLPKTVARRALLDMTFVALTAGEGLRQQLDQLFADFAAEPSIAIETTEREMLMPLVAAGIGVALIPDAFARARPVPGITLHDVSPVVQRAIGAVVAAAERSVLVGDFLDALVSETDLRAPRRSPPRRTTARGR